MERWLVSSKQSCLQGVALPTPHPTSEGSTESFFSSRRMTQLLVPYKFPSSAAFLSFSAHQRGPRFLKGAFTHGLSPDRSCQGRTWI